MNGTMPILHKDIVEEFTDHLNNQPPATKFTHEFELLYSLAMLDTKLTWGNVSSASTADGRLRSVRAV